MTIKDIARLSGYSISTVSRALNDSPDVSDQAKKKIMKIVEQEGFVPNRTARQLKQQVSNHIAVIVKGTQNLLFAGILEQIQHLFRKENYAASVYYLDEHANEVQQALQLIREQKPKAFLFLGGNVDFFKESFHQITVPSILVTTAGTNLGFANLSSAFTDDVSGGAMAVEHLLSLNHKNIGVIGGDLNQSVISRLRYTGCQQTLLQHTDSKAKLTYTTSRFSFEGGYQAMEELLKENKKISAVFAMSDVMAIGAIRALVDKGIKVPEEISVMGYDGIDLGHYYNPSLTTIHQDQQLLASRSVSLLIGMLNGTSHQAVHETVPFTLMERESTTIPKKDR